MNEEQDPKKLRNEDPLSGAPASHPVATGVGAVLGGAAGAALGTMVAGPVGTAAGASMAVGAVAGGLLGKGAGEIIDPTVEDAYWRERHGLESYGATEPYETYEPAYRSGYEGFKRHGGKGFEEVEPEIRKAYEKSGSRLPWEKARPASLAAYDRVYQRHASAAVQDRTEGPSTGGNL